MTKPDQITVLPKGPAPALTDFTTLRPCIVCDAYITGIEKSATPVEWGFRDGNLENIDHHAPQSRFETDVTSTELAIMRVNAAGVAPPNVKVVINHTDCDSLLSSAIVAGLLQPLDRYREAALAADHTGDENEIADLLQGMDGLSEADRERCHSERSEGSASTTPLELALNSLAALDSGAPLPPIAQHLVAVRKAAHLAARNAVKCGAFTAAGGIAWAAFPAKVDGELFVPLLPNAEIVVVGFPHETAAGMWTIKARLGRAKCPGMSLQRMGIETFDPNWGGRWDAGSNNRGGTGRVPGTEMTVAGWVKRLARRLGSTG